MANIWQVIFFSFIGGVFSLVGGLLLFSGKKQAYKFADYATPFAAGALLAAAFLELLTEALHEGDPKTVLRWVLGGMILFFVLESTLVWFHHHHDHKDKHMDPAVPLIIIGDTVHNFIDGIAIAVAFLINVPTGIVTTLAIAAHEIPSEIGDMGLLLSKGIRRRKVFAINIVSAFATTVGAVLFFSLGSTNEAFIGGMAGLTAGFFIYIAASDIIPSIHETTDKRVLRIKTLLLIAGVIIVGVSTELAHQFIAE